MIKVNEIYWIAAYLEGEGCFLGATRKGYFESYITVSSSDRDILVRARRILRATSFIMEQKNKIRDGCVRKKHYRFSVSGKRAIGWMMTLYPLMGLRRQEKIREIITSWKAYRNEKNLTAAKQQDSFSFSAES